MDSSPFLSSYKIEILFSFAPFWSICSSFIDILLIIQRTQVRMTLTPPATHFHNKLMEVFMSSVLFRRLLVGSDKFLQCKETGDAPHKRVQSSSNLWPSFIMIPRALCRSSMRPSCNGEHSCGSSDRDQEGTAWAGQGSPWREQCTMDALRLSRQRSSRALNHLHVCCGRLRRRAEGSQ